MEIRCRCLSSSRNALPPSRGRCVTSPNNGCEGAAKETKGLFTWREGAPANRATLLGGLKHSPPLHASHLGETESVERPLITTNKMADNRNVLAVYYYFFITRSANGRFSVSRAIILHSTN